MPRWRLCLFGDAMMGRFLAALLFLWAGAASAQFFPFLGPGRAPSSGGGGGCAEATSYLSGLTTSYTTAYITMICGMVTDGDFAQLERLYIHATDNSTNALKDIITGAAATITSTATFTANSGYVPTSGTAALNTGFNFSTATKYLQNSATVFAWTTGAVNDNGCPVGEASLANDIALQVFDFGGNVAAFINSGTQVSVAGSDANGLFAADRTSSTAVALYKNGSSITSGSATSGARPNTTLQGWNCSGSAYSHNVAVVGAGGSLGAAGQLRVYNRIHTFLNTVNPTLFP